MATDHSTNYFFAVSDNRVRTTWDDLLQVGISRDTVFKMFENEFEQKPKAVYLNEDICTKYGHMCYNNPGAVTYSNTSEKKITTVGNTKKLINDTDQEAEVDATLATKHSRSASVTVTQTSSVSFKNTLTVGSAELGISDEFSTQFTFENKVGSTSTDSESVEVSDTIHVSLPPHSYHQNSRTACDLDTDE